MQFQNKADIYKKFLKLYVLPGGIFSAIFLGITHLCFPSGLWGAGDDQVMLFFLLTIILLIISLVYFVKVSRKFSDDKTPRSKVLEVTGLVIFGYLSFVITLIIWFFIISRLFPYNL